MKTAFFWNRIDDGKVKCSLCPHGCVLAEGVSGLCRSRKVVNGELVALGYGLISSAGLDPIEKKPLYHFRPGSDIFSIGGWGCDFSCSFCQNWNISQSITEDTQRYSPADIVKKALACNSTGIAYTYNEPLINLEFVKDCSLLAKREGLANVLVTNGYIESEPAVEILPLIDAINVDIKSMADSFYRKYCGARLKPVLDFAIQARESGCHLEITNLIIPGLNDNEDTLAELAVWIGDKLGRQTPLHLSAYHPQYKMNEPRTTVETLESAYDVCRKHLSYVYLGNVSSAVGRDTNCVSCGALLIARNGYSTEVHAIKNNVCCNCGEKVTS